VNKDPRVWVALVSLLATLFLVAIKFLTYLFTGSLSILAESLHSSLDLLSTIITLYAVSIASKPPDIEHMYGHGKAENLGGLAEALLLIITSLWVIYEAIQRITTGAIVELSVTAALVMITSLIIDYSRSRALYNTAKKYGSQALEADALHYSSDLISSGTVLAIIIYSLIAHPSEKTLVLLDSITASLISIYFTRSSYILSKRAIDELMDRTPKEIIETIKQITKEQSISMKSVRARKSGNKIFIDMIIKVSPDLNIEEAHKITEKLENIIKNKYNKSDVDMIIHVEPEVLGEGELTFNETLENKIIKSARNIDGVLNVNDVNISYDNNKIDVRLHIETNPNLSISEAHNIATKVEKVLKRNINNIRSVVVHIEPYHANKKEPILILYQILHKHPEIYSKIRIKSVMLSTMSSKQFMDITCLIKGNTTVEEAHNIITQLENYLINELGDNFTITIHTEPEKKK
jgi:cation diffusion facilitator family transporter